MSWIMKIESLDYLIYNIEKIWQSGSECKRYYSVGEKDGKRDFKIYRWSDK